MTHEMPIGSVIYNILEPGIFLNLPEIAGKWIELRSDKDITDSELVQSGHWPAGTSLPDGRGVFIRGMNQDQSSDKGDPLGNRSIGAWQADAIIQHSHDFPIIYNWIGPNDTYAPVIDERHSTPNKYNSGPTSIGDNETRPRNILLYTYIKLSN